MHLIDSFIDVFDKSDRSAKTANAVELPSSYFILLAPKVKMLHDVLAAVPSTVR